MSKVRCSCTWMGAIALLLLVATPVLAEDLGGASDAAMLYARGESQLKQGQVDEAAKTFLLAARAEPGNKTYVDRAMALRRVQGLRRFVAQNPPSERWKKMAYSLHIFYLQNGIPNLALDLDKQAHAKLNDAETATWLAEAHLALGQNVEAANVLVPYSATSAQHALYHAIALARLGHPDQARTVAAKATVDDSSAPGFLFGVARLRALLGETDAALATLRTSLEKTPAPAIPYMRELAQTSQDLSPLRSLPAFAAVLRTESKVAQTCSGGSSCAGCPNRGNCGGGK